MLARHLLFALLVACGGGPRGVTLQPTTALSPNLHVGDHVVYRFSGAFTREPVTLREEVLAIDAARVTIDVRATRGRDERHWIQSGPSSADARWSNATDAIDVVLASNKKQRVPNPDNATLARLYEWILVAAEGAESGRESSACDETLATTRASCTCERLVRGPMHVEESRCRTFGWQRGPGRWTNAAGEVVWQVEVVEVASKP
jgi:hypothetical protein